MIGWSQENISLVLNEDMRELEVFIKYDALKNKSDTNNWCKDIRLFIVYDAYGEFQQG